MASVGRAFRRRWNCKPATGVCAPVACRVRYPVACRVRYQPEQGPHLSTPLARLMLLPCAQLRPRKPLAGRCVTAHALWRLIARRTQPVPISAHCTLHAHQQFPSGVRRRCSIDTSPCRVLFDCLHFVQAFAQYSCTSKMTAATVRVLPECSNSLVWRQRETKASTPCVH